MCVTCKKQKQKKKPVTKEAANTFSWHWSCCQCWIRKHELWFQTSVGGKRKLNELRWHIYNHSYTETRGYVSSAFPLQGAADRNVLKSQEETKEPRYTHSSFISLWQCTGTFSDTPPVVFITWHVQCLTAQQQHLQSACYRLCSHFSNRYQPFTYV